MEKIVFNVGSIVSPTWDASIRGKVISVETNNYRIVDWFQGDPLPSYNRWGVDNLTYAMPKESKMNTIKCKYIPTELVIEGDEWKYVVVNRHNQKVVAAFVNDMDAEQYVQPFLGSYYIREVDDGQ